MHVCVTESLHGILRAVWSGYYGKQQNDGTQHCHNRELYVCVYVQVDVVSLLHHSIGHCTKIVNQLDVATSPLHHHCSCHHPLVTTRTMSYMYTYDTCVMWYIKHKGKYRVIVYFMKMSCLRWDSNPRHSAHETEYSSN